jgi:hypothetical protein
MKSIVLNLVIYLSTGIINPVFSQKDNGVRWKPVIDSMYNRQNQPLMDAYNGKISTDSANKAVDIIHRSNYVVLKNIIRQSGYPLYLVMEKGGVNWFNEMVWNCNFDLPFQDKVLKLFKDAGKNNATIKSSAEYLNQLAGFIDKVEIIHNREQVYGTQVNFNQATNLLELKPTKDLKNLDKRRASMKLQPIDITMKEANDQLKKMREHQ